MKKKIFTFNENVTLESLGQILLVALFFIVIFALGEAPNVIEKPIYKDSVTAIEYMLEHLKDPATKEEIVSSKIRVWVSSCIDYNDTANHVAFRVKLNINNVEEESLYLVKIPKGWIINPENEGGNRVIEKEDEKIIKLAYRYF